MPTSPAVAKRVIAANKRLFDWARRADIPVVHLLTQYRDVAEIACNPFWRTRAEDPQATRKNVLTHNIKGMPGVAIIPELYDRARDLVVDTKKRYDCFVGTDLDFTLRAHGVNTRSGNASVKLEGSREIAVLFRAENHKIMKVRIVSPECTLDGGGLPFVWLTNVKPDESVAVLAGFVRNHNFEERDDNRMGHEALTAIALHADESAERAMESFVRPTEREDLRKQAAFWLGESRGKAGFAVLQQMAKSDPSSEVRAQVTFALSVSREPGAIDEMIRMAHDDQNGHVRGQALFWLAQKAGKKAEGAITGAIENDPDTDVKKKAVFALSQMPKDEGVPKLIQVAQTNRNPAVRKQAMFWLRQSNDPRALEFFEKVLSQ